MNDIVTLGYESFFDWNTYQVLLNAVYNNYDYSKIGWSIVVVNIVILLIFYKFWDPVSGSKTKWYLTLSGIAILTYIATSTILYNNIQIIQYIGNYTGDNGQPDADYFIFQMSMISLVYSLVIAFILSIIPFRFVSINNSKNPF